MKISEAVSEILDIAFPRRCAACGKINFEGRLNTICDSCAESLFVAKTGRCLVCSEILSISGNLPDMEGCSECFGDPPNFSHSRAIFAYAGSGKVLIEALKYGGDLRVLKDVELLAREVPDLPEFLENATLVPVPLHWKKRMRRGFNQSELICKTLVKTFPRLNIKIANILGRVKNTPSQTSLEKDERKRNVAGAFEVLSPPKRMEGKSRIIVVDDVMTTSATLSECARALKASGFKNVDAFALARKL